jgi:D-alanyl-D-alanine dipeptidase
MQSNLQSKLVELITISPTIVLDVRYATKNNIAGIIFYPSARVFVQQPVAQAVDAVQQELKLLGLGLKVFDGYRPLSVQKKFWELCPDDMKPYVADPAQGSNHNRGAAIDVTLISLENGQELPMPSAFDDFSPCAHRDYAQMPSDDIRKNCKLLELVMEKYGFVGLEHEWWHFDWYDCARYPLLDTPFDELL